MGDQFQVLLDDNGRAVVATVRNGEITSEVVDALMGKVRELGDAGRAAMMVMDLSAVRFIDSVALGSLVVLLRRVKEGNGRLALTGLDGHSMKVLQVTGLDKVFELFEGVPSALEEFEGSA
jgi:anti-sigma B factor antagonist